MNLRWIPLIALIAFTFTTFAQNDTIFNQVDARGLKQGFWQKSYPDGKLMYRGEFKDNHPVGTMFRYYESGDLQARMHFSEDGNYAAASLFYEDGDISAEGFYYQNLKDSIWKYYSYYSGALVSEENYLKGKKHGTETSYYENGQVSELIHWQLDTKEGPWIQYFPDGKEKLKATYSFNLLNGRYYFYYENGLMMILGNFVDSRRHGPWVFYDDAGKEKYKIEYNFGEALNADALLKSDQEYFEFIEKNMGKFEEPTEEDFLRNGGGY